MQIYGVLSTAKPHKISWTTLVYYNDQTKVPSYTKNAPKNALPKISEDWDEELKIRKVRAY